MKEFNKVSSWLALTKQGQYITIDQVTDIHTDYYCPSCGEVLHGRALESELVDRHFYHLQNNNLESCNCEQAYKRYWKDRFVSVGEVITLPFLKEITCISKETDYKISDTLTADICIKTENNDNVLILFDNNKQVENSDLDYTIYYLNFMQLERDLTNINECLTLLHSEQINKINIEFKNKIDEMVKEFKNDLKKEESTCGIDINKFSVLEDELKKLKYFSEYEMMNNLIKSLKGRNIPTYEYKNYIILDKEITGLKKLLSTLLYITTLNIDLDVNLLKHINNKIYNKGYYSNSWSKCIYFDLIKPLAQEFNVYINSIESIINN